VGNVSAGMHSMELEQAVLGASLIDDTGEALRKAREVLVPGDFYKEGHRTVFFAMGKLADSGAPCDLVTLVDHLSRAGQLEIAGGQSYLMELATATPTVANVGHHARMVKEKSLRRQIKEVGQHLAQGADSEEVSELLTLLDSLKGAQPAATVPALKSGSELQALDVTVSWLIANLLPRQSITLLHGRGGIGKTWLALLIGSAVSKGGLFMGLETEQAPVVYVDFENSLPVLVDRVKTVGADEVIFWHPSVTQVSPPRLDGDGCSQYKALPAGALLIFDTLRASQDLDENSSRDMAFIMARLKELRDSGFTILLLHHTPKGNDRAYKGSTAILDLADHVLGFNKVHKENHEAEVLDDEAMDAHWRLGTRDKTRYQPFHIFLAFDPGRGFVPTDDPVEDDLEEIHAVLSEMGTVNQTQLCKAVREIPGLGKKARVVQLLKRGEGKYWEAVKDPPRVLYRAFSLSPVPLSRCINTGNRGNNGLDLEKGAGNRKEKDNTQLLDNTSQFPVPGTRGTEGTNEEKPIPSNGGENDDQVFEIHEVIDE
jgi:hypothetical protein